jgi:hypothetical protein
VTDLARTQSEPDATVTPFRPLEEPAPPRTPSRLVRDLQRECEAMLQYALGKAREIPAETAQRAGRVLIEGAPAATGDAGQFVELTILHNELSALIQPASGRTLVLLEQEHKAHPILYVFGPVRLVRQMLAFAVFALLSTSLLSALSAVDVERVAQGWFDLNGSTALGVLAFLLSVAGLGAAFSNLSTISRYIDQANYDPTFEGSYWVRVVLGLISGVVLGEILFDLVIKSAAGAGGLAPAGERIVLAFLGGFATAPVQRLLTNLSDAVGTLLHGRQQPAVAQRPTAAAAAATPRPGDQK